MGTTTSEYTRWGLVWRTLKRKPGAKVTIVRPEDVVEIVVVYGRDIDELDSLTDDEDFLMQYNKTEGDSLRIVRIH